VDRGLVTPTMIVPPVGRLQKASASFARLILAVLKVVQSGLEVPLMPMGPSSGVVPRTAPS
jgi:hypothetical protein